MRIDDAEKWRRRPFLATNSSVQGNDTAREEKSKSNKKNPLCVTRRLNSTMERVLVLAFSTRKSNGVGGENSISGRHIPWGFSCEDVQKMESRYWFSGERNTNEKEGRRMRIDDARNGKGDLFLPPTLLSRVMTQQGKKE
ncbi:hypothetical protein CEXT_180001 [Caerostris extrusa]|uniref:Uncharacterized protein n=1 Tax=Caerostris extrusa TaxID=172846 RepID=A0AAV4QD01_CAEEX|nr:hypothetical protein CEXT_180001 [Caerostris extrusa]